MYDCIHLKPETTGLPGKLTISRDTLCCRLSDAEPTADIDAMMAWYALNQKSLEAWRDGMMFDEDLIKVLKRV